MGSRKDEGRRKRERVGRGRKEGVREKKGKEK